MTSHPASIVILTSRATRPYAIVNFLARSHVIKGIVFEDLFGLKMRLLRRRWRTLGLVTVLNQLLFKVIDVLFFQKVEAIKALQVLGCDASVDKDRLPDTAVLEVSSINSAAVGDFLGRLKPDFVVVSGTSLLGKELLDLLGATPVINLHCGITPRYRGAHGAFWAITNGDWENVGTTVHLIDKGVDTGCIVGQSTITVEADDNPRTLALKQYCSGIPLVGEAIERLQSGNFTALRRNDLDSRIYSSPTLTAYLRFRKRMRDHFKAHRASRLG
jgi:folate-dependent phosphoribosylglycinamide formyltransferase PurN